MRNEKLEAFLYKNRLKSSDLVEYWGVTKGVVSQILNGTTKLPTKRLEELLNNPHGWDVSMLTENEVENPVVEQPQDMSIADKLFALVESQQRDIKTLLAMLKEKDEEISRLREELDARKRGCASNVAPSSNVTAV